MSISTQTKKNLFALCEEYVNSKISLVQNAMNASQEAANSESKGSAGDKHETGRAMMHLETEKNSRQLSELLKLHKVLPLLKPEEEHQETRLGSLVKTSNGFYYLSIAMGKVELDHVSYFVISPVSPIGQLLTGKKIGDILSFGGREIIIKELV